jgi:hypothetical protein
MAQSIRRLRVQKAVRAALIAPSRNAQTNCKRKGALMRQLFTISFFFMSALCHAYEPPINPALAQSSWPIFHRNSYAQASGQLNAIASQDRAQVQRAPNGQGAVSSWTVLPQPYSDGSQAAYGSNRFGVVKYLVKSESFEKVMFLALPRKRFDFDLNLAVLRDNSVLTTSKLENAFYRVADTSPNCPTCGLVVVQKVVVPKNVGQITGHFSVTYDGTVISLIEGHRLAAVSLVTTAHTMHFLSMKRVVFISPPNQQ